jgi:NADH dehydrogenase
MEKHIVVAGMGFGGLAAVLALSKAADPDVRITLVDRHRYHQFNATLYEVATAWMPDLPEGCIGVLKRSNCVPVEQLLLRMPGVHFRQGNITKIDSQRRILTFGDGETMEYDALIVALGSETYDFGIPGVAQFSVGLKNIQDAIHIRCAMETAVADAAQDKRSERIVHVLIGGGGFSGSEFSAELIAYARVLAKAYRFPKERIHVEILEAGPHLLPGLDAWASSMAERRLTKLGVKMRLGTRVVRVTKDTVELSTGDRVPYELFVWTGGVRANSLVRSSGLTTDERGRLMVAPTLRTNESGTFAVGDTIAFTPNGDPRPLPWVASLAVGQGKLAAANALRFLRGEEKLEEFQGKLEGFVVPVGGKYAIAILANGIRLSGFPAWVLRQFINLRYFLSILGPIEALRMWFSELTYYTRND